MLSTGDKGNVGAGRGGAGRGGAGAEPGRAGLGWGSVPGEASRTARSTIGFISSTLLDI
jgi:hypothetical protein